MTTLVKQPEIETGPEETATSPEVESRKLKVNP